MSGDERAIEEAAGLPRRQFMLAGVAGAAALLLRKPLMDSGVAAAAPCPLPSSLCGDPKDTGDRVHLWLAVRVIQKKQSPPPFVSPLQVTPNYVILHGAPETSHNFLLVPTCRIAGIECPFIWGSTAYPRYWSDAWEQAQPGGAAPVKYAAIGLGINSASVRQQDQLHIHLAGILSGVPDQLSKLEKAGKITSDRSKWRDQVVPVTGRDPQTKKAVAHYYRALIFRDKSELRENLFRLLGKHVPAARKNKPDQMLVVTPRSAGGFYVLNSDPKVMGGGTGSADFLLVYN
jgi:CDP-diacylglycerol pyrophosphatase